MAYPHNNIGREIIPLTLTNQTGRPNLFIYLVGTTDPDHSANNTYYLSDFNGNVTLCAPTSGETTYSLQLPPDQTLKLPRLSGMRLYFSFDKPLMVQVGENGIPSAPAGWVKDSNFGTLFDWIELTWEVNATDMTLGGNTTQVDMFGLPVSLTLVGFDPDKNPLTQQGGFSQAGLRGQIINTIKQAAPPWNQLAISDEATNVDLRVVAPYHGMELGLFPRNQLDDYIDSVWTKYEAETLTASAQNATFAGRTVQDDLVFTPTGATGDPITFPKPDSFTVYTSGPIPTETTAIAGIIGAALQASFMRSTLLINSSLPDCDSSQYYQDEPVNIYAQTFHKYGTDGGAYAFGFDDVCSKSSFIIVHNPVSAQISLLGF